MTLAATTVAPTLDEALGRDLDVLRRANLRRVMYRVERRRGAEVVVDGRPAVDFASNDYLGLAGDPRLARALADALARDPTTGAAAARLISGNHPLHVTLEQQLARLKGAERALLFPSGYMANAGAIPALASRGDVIYADALNHASLIDGCRLSRAELRVYPHADLAALRAMLGADRGRFRRALIVTDAVFSMDGDLAPLPALLALAREHGAWTYADDAHGTGVLGAGGRGSAEHWGVEGELDITMGTLGKALGTAGAFIAGSATLVEFLIHRARSFVFTTGSPPALAGAASAAIGIAIAEPERRARLWENARGLRARLRDAGFDICADIAGHILPVVVGDAERTARAGAALRERGFLVGAVRPPTVPLGTSRLRITVSASHTAPQMDGLAEALAAELMAVARR